MSGAPSACRGWRTRRRPSACDTSNSAPLLSTKRKLTPSGPLKSATWITVGTHAWVIARYHGKT